MRYDYRCEKCEEIHKDVTARFEDAVFCEKCKEEMKRLPVGTRSYRIKGDNSSSTRPRRVIR